MKKRIWLFLAAVLVLSMGLSACSKKPADSDVELPKDSGSTLLATYAGMEFEECEGGYRISKYTGDAKELLLPSTYKGKPVVEIGRNAFQNRYDLKKVTIPDSVKVIGISAFSHLGLTEVYMSDSVTVIEREAFAYCHQLTSIRLSENLQVVRGNSFNDCRKLYSYEGGVGYIDRYAASHDQEVTSITLRPDTLGIFPSTFEPTITDIVLPEGLKLISAVAFGEYGQLKEINIPASVEYISERAFQNSNLQKITFAEGSKLKYIGEDCFNSCTELTNITLPDSIEVIERNAFSGCTALESINIPSKITVINEGLFIGCSKLKSISIPENVTKIKDLAFYNCSSLTEITIPKGVTEIGSSAFSACSSLTEITIPAAVTTIGDRAFAFKDPYGSHYYETSLKTVTFAEGSQISFIGEHAFNSCTKLESISIPSSIYEIRSSAFVNCTSLKSIELMPAEGLAWYATTIDGVTLPEDIIDTSSPTQNAVYFTSTHLNYYWYHIKPIYWPES